MTARKPWRIMDCRGVNKSRNGADPMKFYRLSCLAAFGIIALVVSVFATAGVAADRVPAYYLTAEAIRAQHPQKSQPELRLIFERDEEGGDKETVTLGLGDDYAYAKGGDGLVDLFDFKLRRHFVLNDKDRVFISSSIFAALSTRSAERYNREQMEKGMAQVPAQERQRLARAFESVWLEAEFGFVKPSVPRSQLMQSVDQNGAAVFQAGGVEWARVGLSGMAISETQARLLARLLRHVEHFHPDAVALIEREKRIPLLLSGLSPEGLEKNPQVVYRFKKQEMINADFPLPAAYRPQSPIEKDDEYFELMQPLWPVITAAAQGTQGSGPRPLALMRADAAKAYAAGQYAETYLQLYAIALHYGDGAEPCDAKTSLAECVDAERAGRAVLANPEVKKIVMVQEFDNQRRPKEAVEAIKLVNVNAIQSRKLLDLIWAKAAGKIFTTADAKLNDKLKPVARVLRDAVLEMPYAGAVYNDFAALLFLNYRSGLAWSLLDVARNLPTRPKQSLLDQTDQVEQRILKDFPEFF